MLEGCVLAGVRLDFHEFHPDLQGRIGEDADEVGFRRNLQWHQVEHSQAERTNLLTVRPFVAHREDVLLFQFIDGRKLIG